MHTAAVDRTDSCGLGVGRSQVRILSPRYADSLAAQGDSGFWGATGNQSRGLESGVDLGRRLDCEGVVETDRSIGRDDGELRLTVVGRGHRRPTHGLLARAGGRVAGSGDDQ